MWALFKTHVKTILLTRLRTELLIIREMKISAPMRDHLTPIRMAIIKKNLQIINAGEDVEKRELPCTVGWNVN